MTEDYLNKTVTIVQDFKNELDIYGSQFNIFSILNVSSNEVRLHSNFIYELLNTKGTHSFGTLFFELFLTKLKNKFPHKSLMNFDINNMSVEVDKYIGFIKKNRYCHNRQIQ